MCFLRKVVAEINNRDDVKIMQTLASPRSPVRWLGSLLVVACLCAGFPTAQAQADPLADDAYLKANRLFNLGLFEQAIMAYRNYLKKFPTHSKRVSGQYGMGISHFKLKQYDRSVAVLGKVVGNRNCPDVPRANLFWGQSLLMTKKPGNAEGAFDTGIQALPKPVKTPEDLALLANLKEMRLEALYQQKKWKDVVAATAALKGKGGNRSTRVDFQGAFALFQLKQYPESGAAFTALKPGVKGTQLQQQTHFLLGECLRQQNKIPEAIVEFEVAAGLLGADASAALYRVGMLQFSRENFKAAAKHFDEFRMKFKGRVKPGQYQEAQIFLGRAQVELRQFKQAEKLFADLATDPKAGAKVFLEQGRMLQRQKKYAEAVKVLTGALKKYPADPLLPELLYDFANNHLGLKNFAAAGQAFDDLHRAKPDFSEMADLLHRNAVCKHNTKKYEASLALCGEFLKAHANHSYRGDVSFLAAENQFHLGHHARAITAYGDFLDTHKAHKKTNAARMRVGEMEFELKNWAKALASLEPLRLAKVVGREFDQLEFLVAEIYFRQENFAKALPAYLQFVETKPQSTNADLALIKAGMVSEELKQSRDAIAAYQKLESKYAESPHLPHARLQLGMLQYHRKKYAEAKVVLQKVAALEKHELRPNAGYYLALVELGQGNAAAAAEQFGALAGGFPRHELAAEARLREGLAQLQAEKFAEAQKAFQKFIADHPEHPLIRHGRLGLGRALLKQKNAEAALLTLALVVRGEQLDELGAEAQFLIGECYLGLNEFDLALAEFKKVEAFKLFDEWQANALYGQAVALEGKGEAALATEQLKNLVTKFRRSGAARKAREKLKQKTGDDK